MGCGFKRSFLVFGCSHIVQRIGQWPSSAAVNLGQVDDALHIVNNTIYINIEGWFAVVGVVPEGWNSLYH